MQLQRIFVAGSAGALGRRLVPQLLQAGYTVIGTSRSRERVDDLRRLGVVGVQVDVYDRDELLRVVRNAKPDAVMHQMTDLPQTLAAELSDEVLDRNARVRIEGGRNLVDAALAAGARCFIAQSLGWVYAAATEGHGPYTEQDPLDTKAAGSLGATVRGVAALEQMTLTSPPLRGVVLRYGMLYGPGTWSMAFSGNVPVHIDAAAQAAVLALRSDHRGIFNIAEEKGLISAAKAHRELGWRADYRFADALIGAEDNRSKPAARS